MAYRDPLTGLPNYRCMQVHLKKVLQEADRKDHVAALMMVDLDNFKALNDSIGHPRADEVLREVGERLSQATGSNDLPIRMHGDEFVVVRRRMTRFGRLIFLAKRIETALSNSFKVDGKSVGVGCSIGIALYPIHAESKQALVQCADDALYKAKRPANDQAWRLYRPESNS